jgi:hypothetical protein
LFPDTVSRSSVDSSLSAYADIFGNYLLSAEVDFPEIPISFPYLC